MLHSYKLILLLIPILTFSNISWAQDKKLLILGDSLSAAYNLKQEQGWVSLLQNAFKPANISVINGAISGETTDGGLARLPRLLALHKPTHLLIELGGNDGLQGHSVKKMSNNLQKMIELGKEKNVKVMLQQMQIPANYGARYNKMFVNAYKKLSVKNDIPLIPFFLLDVALKPELMQKDGIHPNALAQPQISQFMQAQLRPLLN